MIRASLDRGRIMDIAKEMGAKELITKAERRNVWILPIATFMASLAWPVILISLIFCFLRAVIFGRW